MNHRKVLIRAATFAAILAATPIGRTQVSEANAELLLRVQVVGNDAARGSLPWPVVVAGQPLEVSVFVVNVRAQAAQELAKTELDRWRAENETRSGGERTPRPSEFVLKDGLVVRLGSAAAPYWRAIGVEIWRPRDGSFDNVPAADWVRWMPRQSFATQLELLENSASGVVSLGVAPEEGSIALDPLTAEALPDGLYEIRVSANKDALLGARAVSGDSEQMAAGCMFAIRKPMNVHEQVEAAFRAGRYYMSHGEYTIALSKFEVVNGADPEYLGHLPLELIGECRERIGDRLGALAAYTEFVAAYPETEMSPSVGFARARVHALTEEKSANPIDK